MSSLPHLTHTPSPLRRLGLTLPWGEVLVLVVFAMLLHLT